MNKMYDDQLWEQDISIAVQAIKTTLRVAKDNHPKYPLDIIHQAAIMAEESGEVVQAAIDYIYHDGCMEAVINELTQTAAMCIRMMAHFYDCKKRGIQVREREGDE